MKRRARRCLGIDIGSTSLKVAELSYDRAGVTIHRLVEAPLDLPPDAPAEDRWAAIARALRDLLRSAKITNRQAAFALPGHAVFVRRVRLPRTHEERLQRIIRFEARQQIPFPLEQTLLQYQITPTEVEDEVEVLLVAIKRDLVEHYMAMIRRLGLRPIHLGVTSFALYNFHMFNQGIEAREFDVEAAPATPLAELPEEDEPLEAAAAGGDGARKKAAGGLFGGLRGMMGGKKKAAASGAVATETETVTETSLALAEPDFGSGMEEVKGYLHIGAATMDLAIGRTGPMPIIGFTRSIPLAGNQLTRAIQAEMNTPSFSEAEQVKHERARVILPGESVAPEFERPSRAIMPVVDRMVAEIRRSLDFYISQPDGMAVDRLVMSGGQLAMPNLAEFIRERVGTEVEVVDEIRNPAVRWNMKTQPEPAGFIVAIGLALQGLGAAVIDVDFLPESLKGWIEFKQKNLYVAAMAVLVGGMIFVGTLLGDRMISMWNAQTRNMNAFMIENAQLLSQFITGAAGRVDLDMKIGAIEKSVAMLPENGAHRDLVVSVISLLQSICPSDVTFAEIAVGPNGDMVIKARSRQQQSPSNMAMAMRSLPNIEEATLSKAAVAMPGATVNQFEIRAKLKGKLSKVDPPPTPIGVTPGAYGPGPAGDDPRNQVGYEEEYDS